MMMVMISGKLAFSPEFEKAKADLQAAREKYTALVEEYSQLIGVVGQNLETEYMLKIGRKEHELFACQVEILRLKREISLFQSASNRGESISAEKVSEIIAHEFAEYKKQLEEQCRQLQIAQKHFAAKKWTPEEVKAFKKLYHDLVRKLHLDLNPNLSDGARSLWERIQTAYKENDWNELFLLADMADEFLDGKVDYVEEIDSLTLLRDELEKITGKTADLTAQIADTRRRIPFSYEELLSEPGAVRKKRQELDEEIRLCKEHIKTLKEIRAQF